MYCSTEFWVCLLCDISDAQTSWATVQTADRTGQDWFVIAYVWMVWMMQYGFARFLLSRHQVIWGQGSRQDRTSIPVAEDQESMWLSLCTETLFQLKTCCVLHWSLWLQRFVTFVGHLKAAGLCIICSRPYKVWRSIKWVNLAILNEERYWQSVSNHEWCLTWMCFRCTTVLVQLLQSLDHAINGSVCASHYDSASC